VLGHEHDREHGGPAGRSVVAKAILRPVVLI
jgi:hypothetical protein